MSEHDEPKKKIIIEGVTESGERFRPSDWAQRISGNLSKIRKHRMVYSPLLQPSVREGNQCVLLDPKLKHSNPELYDSILAFARNNRLKICQDDSHPTEDGSPSDEKAPPS